MNENVRTVLDMDIHLGKMTDAQLSALIRAATQEVNFRERSRLEQLAEEYTDKLNDFISEINEKGLILRYDEYRDAFMVVAGN
jgi:hypothetical protein